LLDSLLQEFQKMSILLRSIKCFLDK